MPKIQEETGLSFVLGGRPSRFAISADMTAEQIGQAVILAELAANQGVWVKDLLHFPKDLERAGLPKKPSEPIMRAAHKLDRAMIDAMAWKCQKAPRSTNTPVKRGPSHNDDESAEPLFDAVDKAETRPDPAPKRAKPVDAPRKDPEPAKARVEAPAEPVERASQATRKELFGEPATAIVRFFPSSRAWRN